MRGSDGPVPTGSTVTYTRYRCMPRSLRAPAPTPARPAITLAFDSNPISEDNELSLLLIAIVLAIYVIVMLFIYDSGKFI